MARDIRQTDETMVEGCIALRPLSMEKIQVYSFGDARTITFTRYPLQSANMTLPVLVAITYRVGVIRHSLGIDQGC